MADFVSKSCQGEQCSMCGAPATRKVGEEILHDDPIPMRHNMTAYVCDEHFGAIFSPRMHPATLIARPIDEYHEDMGDVLWWKFPIEEPPYCGSPTDLGYTVEMHSQAGLVARGMVGGWPGYYTHFTFLPDPNKIVPKP